MQSQRGRRMPDIWDRQQSMTASEDGATETLAIAVTSPLVKKQREWSFEWRVLGSDDHTSYMNNG